MTTHYERLRDDERVDEVEIKVVPRFKESGLSGSEWRTSAVVVLRRKGMELFTRGYQTVADAAAHLPWLLRTLSEIDDEKMTLPSWKAIRAAESLCHQTGCRNRSEKVFRIKKKYSREGYEHEPAEPAHRGFCTEHVRRGDQSLEDSDDNYEFVADVTDQPRS